MSKNELIAKWLGMDYTPDFTGNLQACINLIIPKLLSLGVSGYIKFDCTKSNNVFEVVVADLKATTNNPTQMFCDLVIKNFVSV